MTSALMATYNRLPVTFVRGEGAWLEDDAGGRYLDALSGIAVCGLGHAHPGVAQALAEQATTLVHTSNLYRIPLQEQLGEALCSASGMSRVFFANSGAEANEAAIKLARLHGHRGGIRSPTVVVMENAFHGRTLATLTATGNRKAQAGFEPLVQGFVRVPYDDLDALRTVAENRHDLAAVLLEPIQGEGGINIPRADFLPGVREVCDRHGLLMIVDEIQSGMGRSGRLFAYQHDDVHPDVMTLAKALGNGVPIGACLARGAAADLFQPGSHGSTFGGNPLACRAGLEVLALLERGGLVARAATLGEHLLARLRDALDGVDAIVDVRGRGLLIGIELDRQCSGLVTEALAEGLLINVTAERVVRLLPPLTISDSDAELLVDRLAKLIHTFVAAD